MTPTPAPPTPRWRAALRSLPLLPLLTACAPSLGPTATQPTPGGVQALRFGEAELVLDRRVDDLEFGPEGRLHALSSGTGDRRASIRQPGGQWDHIEGIGEQALRGQHWFSPTEGLVVGEGGSAWRLKQEGGAWQRQALALPKPSGLPPTWTDVAFVDAQVGYLCGPNGLLRSQDGGQSWTSLTAPGGSSLVVGGGQVVLNTSSGPALRLQGEAAEPLRAPNAEGNTANLNQLRFGGGRWWGKEGSHWAFSSDLKAWQRPGPRFEAPGGRSLEGPPDVALPFDQGAYLRNAGGFFFWPGEGLKASTPTEAQYSASSNDVVAPDGSLYLKSSTGLSRLAPPADLKALLPG